MIQRLSRVIQVHITRLGRNIAEGIAKVAALRAKRRALLHPKKVKVLKTSAGGNQEKIERYLKAEWRTRTMKVRAVWQATKQVHREIGETVDLGFRLALMKVRTSTAPLGEMSSEAAAAANLGGMGHLCRMRTNRHLCPSRRVGQHPRKGMRDEASMEMSPASRLNLSHSRDRAKAPGATRRARAALLTRTCTSLLVASAAATNRPEEARATLDRRARTGRSREATGGRSRGLKARVRRGRKVRAKQGLKVRAGRLQRRTAERTVPAARLGASEPNGWDSGKRLGASEPNEWDSGKRLGASEPNEWDSGKRLGASEPFRMPVS
jgi:hypothetical protein